MDTTTRLNPPRVHWLLIRETDLADGSGEVYLVDVYDRDGALAVFSFEDEARMFVGALDGTRRGWKIAKVEDGELLDVLDRIRPSIGFVALDPLPNNIAPGAVDLVCVGREYFTYNLLRRIQRQGVPSPNVS